MAALTLRLAPGAVVVVAAPGKPAVHVRCEAIGDDAVSMSIGTRLLSCQVGTLKLLGDFALNVTGIGKDAVGRGRTRSARIRFEAEPEVIIDRLAVWEKRMHPEGAGTVAIVVYDGAYRAVFSTKAAAKAWIENEPGFRDGFKVLTEQLR